MSVRYGSHSSALPATPESEQETPRKRPGPVETPAMRNGERAKALRALTQGLSVVYAMRLPDGVIKIGCSTDLAGRRRCVHAEAEILGFRFGELEDERAIHAILAPHRVRGREWYEPHPAVLDVVNEMRAEWNLPPITP